jgi:hypothetical protein
VGFVSIHSFACAHVLGGRLLERSRLFACGMALFCRVGSDEHRDVSKPLFQARRALATNPSAQGEIVFRSDKTGVATTFPTGHSFLE